jgi:threonine/homoserine/homoserine lactone efflux protein
MDAGLALRGLLVGLSIAAPVGPIGVLCIRRTLADGRAIGLATGLGAAAADGVYGAIAGFGITAVADVLVGQQRWLRIGGGVFLLYLGVRAMLAQPPAAPTGGERSRRDRLGAFTSTFALTLANPATILSFVAIFAGLGVGAGGGDYGSAVTFVAGVVTGSALWWLLLTTAVARLGRRVGSRTLRWVNRASGAVLAAFGLVALLSAAR